MNMEIIPVNDNSTCVHAGTQAPVQLEGSPSVVCRDWAVFLGENGGDFGEVHCPPADCDGSLRAAALGLAEQCLGSI